MKKCAGCQSLKEVQEFGKNRSTFDGLNCYCKICARLKDKESHYNNREKRLAKISKYYQDNKEKRNAYQVGRHHVRKTTDPMYILKRRYRNRVKKLFRYKGTLKKTSSMDFLGCSAEEFKIYFESLFTEGMTWDKVYSGEIHIDHIVAISLAKTEEDLVKLSHYTNLQPLWAADNLKKGKH